MYFTTISEYIIQILIFTHFMSITKTNKLTLLNTCMYCDVIQDEYYTEYRFVFWQQSVFLFFNNL